MGCHCFLRYHRSQRCQHPQCRAQRLGTNLARRSNRPHLHNRREISATLPQTYRAAPDRSRYRHRHDPTALHQSGQRLNAFAGPYHRLSRSFSKGKRARECVLEKLSMAKPSISDGKPSITNPILHLIGNSNTARPRNTSLHTDTSQIRNSDVLPLSVHRSSVLAVDSRVFR